MNQELLLRAAKLNKLHHRKDRVHRAASILSFVIVLCTVWSLMLPAVTLNGEAVCGFEEHTHGDGCYETVTLPACGLEESEGHAHTDECYAETEAYICGLEESEGHTHTDACYTEERTLSCELEESEGHTHTDECFTETLICDISDEEHIHDESCYTKELSCGQEESEGHIHTDDCYTTELVLSCELEESEGHTHTDECLGTVKTLICEIPESEGHTHSEECGTTEEQVLVCDKPEHTHTDDCYPEASDNSADTETAAYWESTFANVTLTGNYADDVLAIAETQLGYHESTKNFQYDGSLKKGYTRYGAWYGDPYGDWCAMFVSFCMRYAGVPESVIPSSSVCNSWTVLLDQLGHFEKAGGYTPRPGDVIFFDTDGEGGLNATHVGLVAWVGETSLGTIEGNAGDCVCTNEYSLDSAVIYGYGRLGDKVEETVLTYTDGNINAELTVSPALDGEAELRVEKLDPVEDETLWKNMAEPVAEQMIEEEDEPETLDLYRFALLKNGEPLELTEDYELTLDATVPAPVTDGEQEEPSESVQSFALSVLTEEELKTLEEQEEAEQLQREDEEEIDPVAVLLTALMPETEEKQEVINEEETLPALKALKLAQEPTDDPEQAALSYDGDGMFYGFALAAMPEAALLSAPEDMEEVVLLSEPAETFTPTANVASHKQIEYLYNKGAEGDKKEDQYRLHLDAGELKYAEPIDLLIVVDRSYSMKTEDMDGQRRDTVVSKILNGEESKVTDAGLISKFLALHPENEVAVIEFHGDTSIADGGAYPAPDGDGFSRDASMLLGWTKKTAWDSANNPVICATTDTTYTDYCAAYLAMSKMLDSKNDGHQKLVIFLSDGVPTYYLEKNDGGYKRHGNGTPDGKNGTNQTKCKNGTLNFFDSYSGDLAPIYTIGIGNDDGFDTFVLEKMSSVTDGQFFHAKDSVSQLEKNFEAIVYGEAAQMTDLVLTDTLSEYVSMSGNITVKAGDTKLYELVSVEGAFEDVAGESGNFTVDNTYTSAEGETIPMLQSVIYDPAEKTITATFNPAAALDVGMKYELAFDVELTAAAALKYKMSGYDAEGAANTDYGDNETSVGQGGFYSNKEATASYTYNGEKYEDVLPKPVVQAVEGTEGHTSDYTLHGYITQHKTIDALREGTDNPDTKLDNIADKEKTMTDFYRLYLDAGQMTVSQPVDLLVIIDRSSSMEKKISSNSTKSKDTAVSEILNGTQADRSDGLISQFLRMHPENQIAIVGFGGTANYDKWGDLTTYVGNYDYNDDAEKIMGWTTATGWQTHSNINCEHKVENGTNYSAAYMKAIDVMKENTSTHPKLVAFLSDGKPTFRMVAESKSSTTGYGRYGTGDESNNDSGTNVGKQKTAFDDLFKQYASDHNLKIYTIGIGMSKSDTEVMEYMSTQTGGTATITSDYDTLMKAIKDIIYGETGKFQALSITDTLSPYVDIYKDKADIKVTATVDGTKTTLYERNSVAADWTGDTEDSHSGATTFNADFIESVTLNGKTIKVTFNEDVELDKSAKYELSYNVKVTQTAYDEFKKNVDAQEEPNPKDLAAAYAGMKGDAATNYGDNATSSNQYGFRSNASASAAYKLGDTPYDIPYDHPVVQASYKDETLDITVVHEWPEGVEPPADTTVTARLYTSVDGKTLTPTDVIYTLKSDNDTLWTETKTDLPLKDEKGNELKYYVIADPLPGYYSNYDKPDKETVLADEPTRSGSVTIMEGTPFTGRAVISSTPGVILPNTGGSGTALFTGFGLALLALGAALTAKQTRTYKRERKINIKGKVTMKKALALLMTLVMILALGVTAFAADGNTITVPETDPNTYDVHQIFVGDYYDKETDDMSDDVLSNVKWGKNGIGTAGERVDKTAILDELEKLNSGKKDVEKLAVILTYFKGDSEPFAKVSAAKPLTNVPDGYYLIGDSADTTLGKNKDGTNAEAHTLYLIKVVGDIEVNRKNVDVPTVVKKIVEGESLVRLNNATKGDTVTYQITGTIPEDASVYDYYYFVFNDKLQKGLTFDPESVSVTINGFDAWYNLYTGEYAGEYTFRVALRAAKYAAGKDVVLTYSATLNTDANIWTETSGNLNNRNLVNVSYSNDPNFKYAGTDSDKPGLPPESVSGVIADTPDSKVYTYTTQLDLQKVDSKTKNALTGASFTLMKGETVLDEDVAVDENGLASFRHLGAGKYTLLETVTPKGYNTCDPIGFEIVFDADAKTFHIKNENELGVDVGTSMTLVVENVPGTVLPTTGGVGTTMFYVIGGLLVFGAAVLLITKKRMKAEK